MFSGICLLSCPPWRQQRWGPLLSFVVRKPLHSAPRWSVAGWSGHALSQHCDVLPPTPGVIACPQPPLHTLISTSTFVSPHMPSRADVGTVRPPALRYSSRMIQWLLLRQAVSSSSTHSSTLSRLGIWVWMKVCEASYHGLSLRTRLQWTWPFRLTSSYLFPLWGMGKRDSFRLVITPFKLFLFWI